MPTLTDNYPMGSIGGSCWLCHAAPRKTPAFPHGEPIVDLGVTIDFEGAVLICWHCAAEIARLIGFADPATVADRDEQIERLRSHLDILRNEVVDRARLVDALEGVRELLPEPIPGPATPRVPAKPRR